MRAGNCVLVIFVLAIGLFVLDQIAPGGIGNVGHYLDAIRG